MRRPIALIRPGVLSILCLAWLGALPPARGQDAEFRRIESGLEPEDISGGGRWLLSDDARQDLRGAGGVQEIGAARGFHAEGISSDGSVVVGHAVWVEFPKEFEIRGEPITLQIRLSEPAIWTAAGGLQRLDELASHVARRRLDFERGNIGLNASPACGRATAVSGDGSVIVGYVESSDHAREAFRWTRAGGLVRLGDAGFRGAPLAMSADGRFLVGNAEGGTYRWSPETGAEFLGVSSWPVSSVRISADGSVIVGADHSDGYIWSEDSGLEVDRGLEAFTPVDVAGRGRIIVGRKSMGFGEPTRAALRIDGELTFLDTLLADFYGIDVGDTRLDSSVAISDDGSTIVGLQDALSGRDSYWVVRLPDCDDDGRPDGFDHHQVVQTRREITGQGTELFRTDRDTVTFGDMIASYGQPWEPHSGQTPSLDDPSPAARLRALLRDPDCGGLGSGGLDVHYATVTLPAVQELFSFEMLLGNEAYADASDPTIALDGISDPGALGELFAFEGVPGIRSLLDEELALLRGRELPGPPGEWLDDDQYFPRCSGASPDAPRIALYNRLPPNAGGPDDVAFRSNYRVTDDCEAAAKRPQGYGDALGYYLTAAKVGIDRLRQDPATPGAAGFTQDLLDEGLGRESAIDEIVANTGEAMAARARTIGRVVDLTFRRDYREDPSDSRREALFSDTDPERAWSMADWARRGAIGAYTDWALLSQLTAPGGARAPRDRRSFVEIGELAAAVGDFQERMDTAGAGLDPLGLVQNVVPFGIDASQLDTATGKSHYEQVRDAAVQAIGNARGALELASSATQQLRDSDESFDAFSERVADRREEFHQRLIEVFGYPSADDPEDNDLDPTTDDPTEARTRPDLVSFLLSDEVIRDLGWSPRRAPGQVQIALSELRIAELRVQEAETALDNLTAEVRDLIGRIRLLTDLQDRRISIIADACEQEIGLIRRLEAIERRKRQQAGVLNTLTNIGESIANPGTIAQNVAETIDWAVTELTDYAFDNEFDIEVERKRIQCWKETELTQIRDILAVDAEYRRLNSLVRETPRLIINRSTAMERLTQASGRLKVAIEEGRRLLRERERIEEVLRSDLVDERWKDMAFRVFRSNAIQKYGALFDLAARYVVLAARAYAYEFNSKSEGDNVLTGIYRERTLGGADGNTGGLQGIIRRLDGSVTVNNFNRPLETLGQLSFSLRRNLLGLASDDFRADDLEFRRFLESRIRNIEDHPVIRDFAQLSVVRDFGPAIVIDDISTEIAGRNFFGEGPEPPHDGINFSLTRNPKIRAYAIRFDGVEADLGIDPEDGRVTVYFFPVGDSILRENNNRARVEDEPPVPWAVVDQFLPAPREITARDIRDRSFNPWAEAASSGDGRFLNSVKRFRDAQAQVELGQEPFFNTNLAGRSAWNTRWILAIPGAQWTSSRDPGDIREKLLQFIYGEDGDPAAGRGITDIRLIIRAYSH